MESPASVVETVPLGFRFHPTDEELVGHYLKHKLLANDSMVHNIIAEVDVCKFEPWDLPAFSKVKSDDPEWFFFSPLGLKFTKSTRCNRKTEAGYWKITGKDRKIKTRGTNNVIGTKKTLVFYKTSGRDRVKTNWVIHEYHAVTFPDDKRRFVLCRLMEKAEKKAEGVTDALIQDEGEPSGHVAADCENQAIADRTPDVYTSPKVNLEPIFPAPPQEEEYDFPSLLQPPIDIDQAPYFQVSSFPDVCFGNEKFPFETSEEEDSVDYSFLDSILPDGDVFICEETSQTPPTFVNDSSASESLREVHFGSSETDDELLSAWHGNILLTIPSVWNEHTDSRENPALSMVESLQDAVYAGPPPVSSKNEVNLENGDNTSDDDSTANASFSVFLIQSVSSPSPSRASSSSPSGSCQSNLVSLGAAEGKSRTQVSISSQAVSQQEELMEAHILESNLELRNPQGTSSRKEVETASNLSPGVNGKGSATIHLEAPLVQRSLFLFFTREELYFVFALF